MKICQLYNKIIKNNNSCDKYISSITFYHQINFLFFFILNLNCYLYQENKKTEEKNKLTHKEVQGFSYQLNIYSSL